MPRKALSLTKKAQISREEHDRVMARAVTEYQAEQEKTGKKRGLRKICMDIQQAYLQETGKVIHINHCTLNNLAKGGQSLSDFNADKRWLSCGEEDILVSYILDNAQRGFPLSLTRLKEHADELIRAKHGAGGKFPAEGVGRNWCSRFIERHSDQIHAFCGRGIDAVRTRSVNEATNKAWYDLLEEVLQTGDKGGPIAPECIYGADETGFQPNGGNIQEKLIGATGQKVQYQARDGSRETITVLVPICADGTSIPPAVIFKGKAYQIKWNQDNTINAK
jgi:hypothetical protein